jgi:hypothetical protein
MKHLFPQSGFFKALYFKTFFRSGDAKAAGSGKAQEGAGRHQKQGPLYEGAARAERFGFSGRLCQLAFTGLLLTGVQQGYGQTAQAWDKTLGGDQDDYLYSMQQTSDGGYILGGSTTSNLLGPGLYHTVPKGAMAPGITM